MDNERDVLGEKIINEINAVFQKDPELQSFEIITTTENHNKSPVIHLEHHLGLESWCVAPVYDYAHKTIISFKLGRDRHNINDTIVKYLNCALLINPDVTTFWHVRRQLVGRNRLTIHKEFQFSAIVLTKKPKSSEAFAYRRWLFSFQSGESIDWGFEISICERCADRSSSNYHAWSHRQWILERAPNFLKTEILLTEKFIKKHICDYSCYHYRQFVLQLMHEIRYFDREENDYTYIKEMVNYYTGNNFNSEDDLLTALLPQINFELVADDVKKSFLYCCNLAAYDISLCKDLKRLFGLRESFENHRRASIKFIVDNCKRLKNINGYYQLPLVKVSKIDDIDNTFLLALKKAEGELGEKHRKWCSLFLGFDYSNETSFC